MKLLLSVIRLALGTLRENKLRSFLTVLGVIMGTGTIIAVGSVLAGLDSSVANTVRSVGANTAIVFKTRIGLVIGGLTQEELHRKPLTFEDAKAIEARCPSVEHVSAYIMLTGFDGPRRDNAR